MENSIFNLNTMLAAVYYNGGTSSHLFKIRTDVTLFGLKGHLFKSTANSTKQTHREWTVLSIDFDRPTQSAVCGSAG